MTGVVALHGFTGTPKAFSELDLDPIWVPYLSGHGPDPNLFAQSYSDEVERLLRTLRTMASAPVHLVAYSMGARVALGMVLQAPELFERATLFGVNPGLTTEEKRQDRLAWEARWIDVLEQDGLAVFEHQWKAQPIFRTQHSLPPRSQDTLRDARLSHTARGLAHAMNVLGLGSMPDFWPRLADCSVPTRLVYGALDKKFENLSVEAARRSPVLRAQAIAGVGHNPLLEAPRDVRALICETGTGS